MELIERDGTRKPVCDRCHRVRVVIRPGLSLCEDCRLLCLAERIGREDWPEYPTPITMRTLRENAV